MKYLGFLTNIPEETRGVLYRISTAIVLLAGTYGILDEQQAAGWVAFAAAVFSGGLAMANTKTKLPPPPPPGDDDGSSAYDVLIIVVIVVALLVLATKIL